MSGCGDGDDPVYAWDEERLLASCERSAQRARGPGGQHVNRHANGVLLRHPASGIEAQCQDEREGRVNLSRALQRLRLRLAVAIRGEADPAWWHQRRRGSRMPVGAQAKGYHLVVAVALDQLVREEGRLAEAARALGVSTSQFAAVLTADKEAHRAADAIRAEHGHGPLRVR